MTTEALEWLACPVCGGELAGADAAGNGIEDGSITCAEGHSFPVVDGIPRLLPHLEGSSDARSIHESFSREWAEFDYEQDRPWGHSIEERRAIALRELDCAPEDLQGKLVLDAGCGPGILSYVLSDMGAEVLAADISQSVDAAHRHFHARGANGIHFVQADMTRPPMRPATFDIVFSGGVLIVNRDTKEALHSIAELVAPGGQIYCWLYSRAPGLAYRLKCAIRPAVARAPSALQKVVAHAYAAQSLLRQGARRLFSRDLRLKDGDSYRERVINGLDFFTPRYRWEHTPAELSQWYRELGFTDIVTTTEVPWGFGVLARKPADQIAPTADTATAAAA